MQAAIKVRHYSNKTWQAYRYWLRQFQTYTKSKDAYLLDMDDVKGFLSHLATNKQVAASSQNQAFNTLLFLFKHALQKEFSKVEGVVRAKRRPLPATLTTELATQIELVAALHEQEHRRRNLKCERYN